MQDRSVLVQFLHPGSEPTPDTPHGTGWNRGRHKRKFMIGNGAYLLNDQRVFGELVFWGEWEPESELVTKMDPLPGGPRYLYRPYYVRPDDYDIHLRDTDPFVFGENFLYGICQQNTKAGSTSLQHLDRGSVVLFGSHQSGNYILDTVFVVDNWIDHDYRTFQHELRNSVSQTYWDVAMMPLYRGRSRHSYRLYFGATYEKQVNEMFSFFPCLPYGTASNGFARPVVKLGGRVISGNLKQKFHVTPRDIDQLAGLWGEVKELVIKAGLCLGTHVEPPSRRND